jgi:copper transport protein
VLAALLPASADAHAFLIRSDPQAGSRLASSPHTLTLYFSEPFVRGSERIGIRRVGGAVLELAAGEGDGAVIRQPLPTGLRGVFVVSWRVLSDDGHISLGEFAFAVGAGGALPASVSSSSDGSSWSDVAASWLFFLGLALALGGVVSERLIWRRVRVRTVAVSPAPAGAGVALAALGSVWLLLLVAGAERGRGFSAGLSTGAIRDAIGQRPGALTLATLAAVVAATPLLFSRRTRVVAAVPLGAAVVATALRGHSGTANDWWASTADVVHLVGAALWIGALAHLVLVLTRSRERSELVAAAARTYSRLALPTVLVVLASGIVTAIPEFRNLAAVTSSSYGRTLLIKAGLIGAALLFAMAARRRALPTNPHPRWRLLRRLTGAESAALVGVLVAVAVLVNSPPPRSGAASALPDLGPAPLGPAVRLADLAGQLVVGVAATKGELQFTIAPPSDQPKESVKLTAGAVEPGGRALDLYPRPCGQECFTIRHTLDPGRNVITVHVSSNVWRGGDAKFVLRWPLAPERPALLSRVAVAMRSLRTLQVTEAVTSGPGSGTPAGTYQLSGRQFMETEEFGGGGVDVRVLGREDGLTELAFALPGSSIWYRMWIDRRYRLRREQILDPGHLIRRTFSYNGRAAASAPSTTTAGPTAQPPTSSLAGAPPAPPAGAVVLGREDGDLAVGLAATTDARELELQTSMIGPDGKGVSALTVHYRLRTSAGEQSVAATLCGSGCYRAFVPSLGRPRSLVVDVSGGGHAPASLAFALPARWPAPHASALLRRATATWLHLHSLVIAERLGSDPTHVLHTRYELAAPDKLSYQISGGADAVIIGNRRWDRLPGQAWKESSTTRLTVPALQWARATNVHLLGSPTVGGRPVWLISF